MLLLGILNFLSIKFRNQNQKDQIEHQEKSKRYTAEQIFDRQIRIQEWDQKLLSEQVALCLGVGGLGSVVALNMVRLGIKKIILLDYDKVDVHNLNRQLLFGIENVNQNKVQAAIKNLKIHNVRDTIIEAYNLDAVKNFDIVQDLISQSTIVFNMIDVGDYFDLAVSSACLYHNKPCIIAGTFSKSLSLDYFEGKGYPCYLCVTDGLDQEIVKKLNPENIFNIKDLSFIPRNNNPIGQSNVILCSICANFMSSIFVSKLFKDEMAVNVKKMMFYINSFESVIFQPDLKQNCQYCKP